MCHLSDLSSSLPAIRLSPFLQNAPEAFILMLSCMLFVCHTRVLTRFFSLPFFLECAESSYLCCVEVQGWTEKKSRAIKGCGGGKKSENGTKSLNDKMDQSGIFLPSWIFQDESMVSCIQIKAASLMFYLNKASTVFLKQLSTFLFWFISFKTLDVICSTFGKKKKEEKNNTYIPIAITTKAQGRIWVYKKCPQACRNECWGLI